MGAILLQLALLLSTLHRLGTISTGQQPTPRTSQDPARSDQCVDAPHAPVLIRHDPARRDVLERARGEQRVGGDGRRRLPARRDADFVEQGAPC